MTISVDIGKFKATIEYKCSIGKRHREIELDVIWVSCGVYEISYHRPRDAEPYDVIVAEDWYPPDIYMSFTPEQFNKVVELYPSAPKQERNQFYKPFYEDYDLSRGTFDFGEDRLFQAFKDPNEDRVNMVNHYFIRGTPDSNMSVFGLSWEDLQRLKELLDSKKDEIFYSGCKISSSTVISDLAACIPSP